MDCTDNIEYTDANKHLLDSSEMAFNVLEKFNHISEKHLAPTTIRNFKDDLLV